MAQVGDSRVYRVRRGEATQLTEDHTLVNYKLKQGLINAEEARTMKGKNVITRAVGHKDYVEVDTREIEVQAGDAYILCSDALGKMAICRAASWRRCCRRGRSRWRPNASSSSPTIVAAKTT